MPLRLKLIGCSLLLCLTSSIALAEVVVVVSVQNPVESLSRNALADLYLGRTSRFPNGQSAIPVDQRENSTAYRAFYRDYLGQTPAQIKIHWSRLIFTGRGQPPRSLADSQAVADFVAKHADATGYLHDTQLDERLRVVAID
jgi:ABC-type phosphate transport system substrate-binding protein